MQWYKRHSFKDVITWDECQKSVKFEVETVLDDGSYLSWIAPDGKSKKKGCTKIQVRVIEYTIDTDTGQQTYRLITSLINIALFPALLLAAEYHDSLGNRKHN
jgi:hypothetical protein